jgi:hypothetical protein
VVLSEVSPLPLGFMFSSITTIASPRPYVTIDGRDVNLDNITGDDYIGGTLTSTASRTAMPANAWPNWYRTVDVRLARPVFERSGKKVSATAEVFNLFNWSNNLSYGNTQFSATGTPVSSFGQVTGAYQARQGQVGMRIDW